MQTLSFIHSISPLLDFCLKGETVRYAFIIKKGNNQNNHGQRERERERILHWMRQSSFLKTASCPRLERSDSVSVRRCTEVTDMIRSCITFVQRRQREECDASGICRKWLFHDKRLARVTSNRIWLQGWRQHHREGVTDHPWGWPPSSTFWRRQQKQNGQEVTLRFTRRLESSVSWGITWVRPYYSLS